VRLEPGQVVAARPDGLDLDPSRARPPRPQHVAPVIAGLGAAVDEDAVRIGDLLARLRGEVELVNVIVAQAAELA
jgi:hypothetical protein